MGRNISRLALIALTNKIGVIKINNEHPFFNELKSFLMPRLDAANVSQSDAVAELVVQVLFESYAGQSVYFPSPPKTEMRASRNQQIIELYRQGVKTKDLACRFNLSRSRVAGIIKSAYNTQCSRL